MTSTTNPENNGQKDEECKDEMHMVGLPGLEPGTTEV